MLVPPNEITPLPTVSITPTISINQQNGYTTAIIKHSFFPIQINSFQINNLLQYLTTFTFPLTDTHTTPSPTNYIHSYQPIPPPYSRILLPPIHPLLILPHLPGCHSFKRSLYTHLYSNLNPSIHLKKSYSAIPLVNQCLFQIISANGVSNSIQISDWRKLVNFSLYVDISHSWVGDLVIMLTNQQTGEKITILDRPGIPNS